MPPSPRSPGTAVCLAVSPNVVSGAAKNPSQDCRNGTSIEEDSDDFYSVCSDRSISSSPCPSMTSTLSETGDSEPTENEPMTVPTMPYGAEKVLEDSESDSFLMTIVKRQNRMQTDIQQMREQLDELKKACQDPLATRGSSNDKLGAQSGSPDEKKVEANCRIFLLPVTESHIHRISKELVKQWKELPAELSLGRAEVEQIDADYRGILEKTYQTLLLWRRKEASKATVGRLVTALENVGRRDVSEILNEVIAADVTYSPHNGAAQSVYVSPKQSMLDIFSHKLKILEDVQSDIKRDVNTIQSQDREQNDPTNCVVSSEFSTNAETLDGTLEMLHLVLKKLARTEGQHQFIDEIKSLLVVQDAYEEKLRESMTTSKALPRRDSVIVEELKAHQGIRMQQSKQIDKLVSEMEKSPEEKCKKCKVCKSCKKRARSNTFACGSGDRPKLVSVKERKIRSAFYTEQEFPGPLD